MTDFSKYLFTVYYALAYASANFRRHNFTVIVSIGLAKLYISTLDSTIGILVAMGLYIGYLTYYF